MKAVTVLDFTLGEVCIYNYEDSVEYLEDFIREKGHNLDNCQWMATDKLILKINPDEN